MHDPLTSSAALLDHPADTTFVVETMSGRGDVKVIFAGPLVTPDGRNPQVRTVCGASMPRATLASSPPCL
jgi:hypothetical protein